MKNKHIGSSFDDFLEEEGLLQEVVAVATKRAISFQIQRLMKEKRFSKQEMTSRLGIKGRMHLDRLLDPQNVSVTLLSLQRTAKALGKKLVVQFV